MPRIFQLVVAWVQTVPEPGVMVLHLEPEEISLLAVEMAVPASIRWIMPTTPTRTPVAVGQADRVLTVEEAEGDFRQAAKPHADTALVEAVADGSVETTRAAVQG